MNRIHRLSKLILSAAFAVVVLAGVSAVRGAADADAASTEALGDRHDVLRGYMYAPRAIRAAVAKVKPSLVTIETVGGIEIGAGGRQAEREVGARPGEGPTTGVILSADGYILTSTFNFIDKPRIITVTLADGSRYVADLLGRDQTRKLVMLKIDAKGLEPVDFVDPAEIRVGQWAISVGVGYGPDRPAVSQGIISAKRRIAGRAIQTDANLSPANYGGPLIDVAGRVIGISVPLNPKAKAVGAGSEWYDSGIGFAATGHGLDKVFDRMKDGQTLAAGLMGVAPDARPRDVGVRIARVAGGSPAHKIGLRAGHTVTHVDGKPVASLHDVKAAMNTTFVGDKISVTWTPGEGEEPQTAELTLEAGPFGRRAGNRQPAKPKAGQGDKPKPDAPDKGEKGGEGEEADKGEEPAGEGDAPAEAEDESPAAEEAAEPEGV